MGITKIVLKRPVTALLIVLSVVFFGIMSLSMFRFELIPDISYPMYAVATVYPGASPKDVDKLITKKIEEKAYNLQGAKDVTCKSAENMSLVVIQYDYDQNMDTAYNDLKKVVDQVKVDFDSSVQDPIIIEMDISALPTMRIAVQNKSTEDIYNYVENTFKPELEKIADVSQVDMSGGRESYIKIALNPEKVSRYNLSINTIAKIIKVADFTYPSGTITASKRELSMSAEVEYDTIESLKSIPIITGNKRTLYLEDIADVYLTKKEATDFGRYDSEDCMVVSVQKVQSASSTSVSKDLKKVLNELTAKDKNLEVRIVTDMADNINDSIRNVFQTMVIAIVLSMIVIFVFLGDIRGSLIIGTSIPFSILTAFCAMLVSGFTLNLITLSSLVLGVGMMVDNSIVMLEGCYRAKASYPTSDLKSYIKATMESSNTLGFSILGSTLTTVVVFAPLGFLGGLAGQFFKPLGFTIVYCMLASFVSALTIVPLSYIALKPNENKKSFADAFISSLQRGYEKTERMIVRHKTSTFLISILILLVGFTTVLSFKSELVPSSDESMIKIDIKTKPGLSIEEQDKIYKIFEEYVKEKPETEHYLLSNSTQSISLSNDTGGQSIIVFLKPNKKGTTKKLVREWKKELTKELDCVVDVENYSTSFTSVFVMNDEGTYSVYLEGTDYDALKNVNNNILTELEKRNDVSNISSYMDNAAPTVKLRIDPILSAAEGFTPAEVGALLNATISGVELYDMDIKDNTYTIYLEYEKGEYDTIDAIENIQLVSSSGTPATIKDIGSVEMEDTPASVQKYNKKYRTEIKCNFNKNATSDSERDITENVIKPNLSSGITICGSQIDEMIDEEFAALYMAIGISIFLVFVVMASQFESIRYSLMVMGTVLFSFMGAFVGLWLTGLKLSLPAILGFLMLSGTAVNNGILYVDTVNQYIDDGLDMDTALVKAGSVRLRPILMTTLTTLVSMIPMAFAYGKNGEILQGLAVADMGGLVVSTVMALFALPVFYAIHSKGKGSKVENLAKVTKSMIKIGEMK